MAFLLCQQCKVTLDCIEFFLQIAFQNALEDFREKHHGNKSREGRRGKRKGENTPEKASSWGFMLSGERGTNDTDPMKPFKKDVFPKKGNA